MRRVFLVCGLIACSGFLLLHYFSASSTFGIIMDEVWPIYLGLGAGLLLACLVFNGPRQIGWKATVFSVLASIVLIAETELWALGPFQIQATPPDQNGETLNVATFNVWASNKDLDATAAYLIDGGFDLIAAQEVGLNSRALPERLRQTYPHQFTCGRGVFIFSRRPFLETGCPSTSADQGRSKPVAWADVSWNDGEIIRFVAVHVARPMEIDRRRPQIERLADFVAANSDRTMILAGDFNAGHAGRSMEGLEAQLAPMRRADNRHPSWPSNRFGGIPLLALDQLWLSEDLMMLYSHRGPDLGSDHRPVIGEVAKRHSPRNAEEVQ